MCELRKANFFESLGLTLCSSVCKSVCEKYGYPCLVLCKSGYHWSILSLGVIMKQQH